LAHHLQGGQLHRLRSGGGAQAREAGNRFLAYRGGFAPLFSPELVEGLFSEVCS
jgi:hypothetical protein